MVPGIQPEFEGDGALDTAKAYSRSAMSQNTFST